jgi:uncharacterized protein YjbJ (UPF0337 family)
MGPTIGGSIRFNQPSSVIDKQRWAISDPKEFFMNWDQVEGKWKQMKGGVKKKWGKLTDDDLDVIAGKKDQLVGKVQERYGISREEAQKQVDSYDVESRVEETEFERDRQRRAS